MKKLTSLFISLFLVLLCIVILSKCNNPIKTWIQKKKIEKAVKTEVQTIEKLQYQYVHDTITTVKVVQGKTHAYSHSIAGTERELNAIPDLKRKVDSLRKELGLKNSEVLDNTFSTNIGFNVKDTSYASDEFGDSKIFYFDKGFLKAKVEIDSPDMKMAILEYHGNIGITGALYGHRKHKFLFIKWGEFITTQQLYCDDSNLKINKISSIKFIRK